MVRSVQLIAVHSKAGGGMDLQSVSTLSLATWAPFAECINSVGLTVLAIREDEAEGKRETQEARGAVVNVGGCVYYFELLDASLQGDSDGHLSVAPPLLVGSGVVLMHDSSADPGEDGVRLRAGNRTFEAVTMAVPELRRRGFVFVPLPRSAD